MPVDDLLRQARQVLLEERDRLAAELQQLGTARASLQRLLQETEAHLNECSRRLTELDERLGLTPQLPLSALDHELCGQLLRDAAVRVLRQQVAPGDEIHYREWLDLLLRSGARVGGRDPTATFLTQIRRASEVESVRPRSGLYRLKAG